jgi:hypothetical protein
MYQSIKESVEKEIQRMDYEESKERNNKKK